MGAPQNFYDETIEHVRMALDLLKVPYRLTSEKIMHEVCVAQTLAFGDHVIRERLVHAEPGSGVGWYFEARVFGSSDPALAKWKNELRYGEIGVEPSKVLVAAVGNSKEAP